MPRFRIQVVSLLAGIGILIPLAQSADTLPGERKTVWSGVYSSQQAGRGAAEYMAACGRCHREDLSGYTGLKGSKFVDNWREDSLNSLWVRISKTMPMGAPATLPEREYLDILAYILQANDFPAGARDLSATDLPNIRFEAKSGGEPVPDFSLVQTVGCLTKDPDGNWRVKQASEPVRTRNPDRSTAAELQSFSGQPLGKSTFRILDGSSLKTDSEGGRKVSVKGFLIRKQNDDRLNTTSVEVVGPACP